MRKYARLGETPTLSIETKEDFESITCICEALSNKKRLEILNILQIPPCSISVTDLSNKLNIPISTLKHHLDILYAASLITISYMTTKYGTTKIIARDLHGVNLKLYKNIKEVKKTLKTKKISIGVGHFNNVYSDNFGFATDKEFINFLGTSYFHPKRIDAQLVFSTSGQIEYYVDNTIAKTNNIKKLKISLEICSEAPFYNNDFISDITFWINNKEILTYVSSGDYGERKGLLNPAWWSPNNTQYGKLLIITIDETGVYLDSELINKKVNINTLNLDSSNKIILKIGNKTTARNIGGWNIFGKNLGDYPQDIDFEFFY